MSEEIENLNELDTAILNKQGWHFIVSYKSKQGSKGSNAHNHALEKAASIKRPTGIRMVEKNELTEFEVWEFWK
jgi:hypothetical protein